MPGIISSFTGSKRVTILLQQMRKKEIYHTFDIGQTNDAYLSLLWTQKVDASDFVQIRNLYTLFAIFSRTSML